MKMKIERKHVNTTRAFVSLGGCEASCVDGDGQVLWSVGFVPGVHDLSFLRQYMTPNTVIDVAGAVTLYTSGKRVLGSNHYYDLAHISGANPDFQPRPAAQVRFERMERIFFKMQEAEKTRERSKRRVENNAMKNQELSYEVQLSEPEAENETEAENTVEEVGTEKSDAQASVSEE